VHPLSRILVAVDFSAGALAAFDRALALGRARGAELTAVLAVPADRPFRWRARERIALIARLRRNAEASGVRFTAGVQHGDPAGVILLHARAQRPDLIVLGTEQRTGTGRLRSGSIAERIAREAEQPVLVVPAGVESDALREFRSIVAAVDFSDASSHAVAQAVAWAGGTGGRLTLVHVVPGSSAGVPRHLYRYGLAEYRTHLMLDAGRRLRSAVPQAGMPAVATRARVVAGDAAAEIARIAADVDADLIVMGVTPRGAVARMLAGDTAARVMRIAARPVLAVPASVSAASPPEAAHTLSTAA
jgi:nucleotide-binding universal stress UspA family protein